MYDYSQVSTAVTVLLGAVAAFVLVMNGWKALKEARRPAEDMRASVEEHTRLLDNDNKRLQALERASNLQLKAQLQIITHLLDGNHVDKLGEVRDEIHDYLIDR